MTEGVELMQEKPSNNCCAVLNEKYTKLLGKYAKQEEIKNFMRKCLNTVNEKYDLIEKAHKTLEKDFEELQVQANIWKDEKDKESGIRVHLEDEVSALKDEIRELKQNCHSYSQQESKQFQERFMMAEKDIKDLKDLLARERERASLERQNAELERKKAQEALGKVEVEKKKVNEAQKLAHVHRKKAEEHRLMVEKLMRETDSVKSMLTLERSRCEAEVKNAESEKQKSVTERGRADLAVAKAEEQREVAGMNVKKAIFEKDRADDLNQKLEKVTNRVKELEEMLDKCICLRKSSETQADEFNNVRVAVFANEVVGKNLKSKPKVSQLVDKMLWEKEQIIIREKKVTDSEKKKVSKLRKVAETHRKIGLQQKERADQLAGQVDIFKLRLEDLQKELQKHVSLRIYDLNSSLSCKNVIHETDTVKLLKKQLKLEKLLVKQAKKVSKLEAVRNNMLCQEVLNLKQECLRLQQHSCLLEKSFLHCGEGAFPSGKFGTDACSRGTLCSVGYHSLPKPGTDSRLDLPYRGPNKKMIQSSAINSSSASFSEPPSMGSQERGNLLRLSEKKELCYNELPIAEVVDSKGLPRNGDSTLMRASSLERKRIHDAVEFIEVLFSKGEEFHKRASEKLALLHDLLDGQNCEPHGDSVKKMSSRKVPRPSKRRKTSSAEALAIFNVNKSEGTRRKLGMDIDCSDDSVPYSAPESAVIRQDQCLTDGHSNTFQMHQYIPENLDERLTSDHMKMLDLDDAGDESLYRRAIAMPLSPSLPEVDFHVDVKLKEVDNHEILVDKIPPEELLMAGNVPPSTSGFYMVGTDENTTDSSLDVHKSSELQAKEDNVDFLKDTGNKEPNILGERGTASSSLSPLKFVVVFSKNKNDSSILRILQTICNSTQQHSSLHAAEAFIQSTLQNLFKAEDLSMKEKVCALLSLLLNAVHDAGAKNSTSGSTDKILPSLVSASRQIGLALSDPVLRRMFLEFCDFCEFVTVIEDFLLQRKVLVYGDASGPEALSSTRIDLILNGNTLALFEVVASAHLLVACGSLFATVCLAVDQIGIVCEMSCNIFSMLKSEPAVLLSILHAFAEVCGSRYLTIQQYSMAMTVVKSLAVFIEKKSLPTDSGGSLFQQVDGNLPKIWSCSANCPFSEGALSIEDVASHLLANLEKHTDRGYGQHGLVKLVNVVAVSPLRSNWERTEDVASSREAERLSYKFDEHSCGFIDILSLIEILASFMDWSWTFDRIVIPLCKHLESHPMELFSAAIVILLGQLGRLGATAHGYEDPGVQKLRERLSVFLCKPSFTTSSLLLQSGTVNSLFGVTPIKFEDIVEDKVGASVLTSHPIPASFIREWFFHLSNEQQTLFRLHVK